MTVEVVLQKKLKSFIEVLKPAGRKNLFSAAAVAVRVLVRGHISRESSLRHSTAAKLNAEPTGHLSEGARSITYASSADHGEVIIPIPGITRAFRDLEITPRASAALTLPISSFAYGHRVSELKAIGWEIFRPKGKDVLMGKLFDTVTPLYLLKKRVTLRQDRSLLPSDKEITSTSAKAMISEIIRATKKAA